MQVLTDVELKNYTTIAIGGTVKLMYLPESLADLGSILKQLYIQNTRFFILAGGSNTVFDDQKLEYCQAVICLKNLTGIKLVNDTESTTGSKNSRFLEVMSGTRLQELVDYAQNLQLAGLTGLNRVPGSVGGAIFGNAGAYGTEIKDSVCTVEAIDLKEFKTHVLSNLDNSSITIQDYLRTLDNEGCNFEYRSSLFKQLDGRYLIVSSSFKLDYIEEFEFERQRYEDIAAKRDSFYPAGLKSPGSCFKNISFDSLSESQKSNLDPSWIVFGKLPVARLLEQVGSKELVIGGARMRPEHANILINQTQAEYRDVQELIQELQRRVLDKFGILIEPEIRLISDF